MQPETCLPVSTKSTAWWYITPGGTLYGVFLVDTPVTLHEFKMILKRNYGVAACRGTRFFVKTRIEGPLVMVASR